MLSMNVWRWEQFPDQFTEQFYEQLYKQFWSSTSGSGVLGFTSEIIK
jgi:hypothetical protein